MKEDALLQREHDRARAELAAAWNGLRRHGRDLIDVPSIVRHHPVTSLTIGSIAGFVGGATMRVPDLRRVAGRGVRGTARLVGQARHWLRLTGVLA